MNQLRLETEVGMDQWRTKTASWGVTSSTISFSLEKLPGSANEGDSSLKRYLIALVNVHVFSKCFIQNRMQFSTSAYLLLIYDYTSINAIC